MLLTSERRYSSADDLRSAASRSAGSVVELAWFRLTVVAAMIASVVITWPLWNARSQPPLLPAMDVPDVSLGGPLIAASLAALFAPRAGAVLVTLLLLYGFVGDQTRMQPQFFSLPLLLWGSLPSASTRLVARAHLISLWFYAGLHKLLSPEFLTETGPRLLRAMPIPFPEALVMSGAVAIAALETGTGILAVLPARRRAAASLALLLHGGILLTLSPVGEMRNDSVWPWNIALAVSGFALIATWSSSPRTDLLSVPVATRALAVFLLVAPLGFYLGIMDAYPAHHLYSAGTARATVYCPTGCRPEQDINSTWHDLNVPLPPEPRLFGALFAASCSPGDSIRIEDPHPPPWEGDRTSRIEWCPNGVLQASHP